jgi:hypothetical protein
MGRISVGGSQWRSQWGSQRSAHKSRGSQGYSQDGKENNLHGKENK